MRDAIHFIVHANSPAWQEQQQQPLTRLATERTTPRDGIHKVCVVVVARCQIPERFQRRTWRGREKHGDPHSLFALVSQSALLGGQERERTSFKLASHSGQIPSPFVATPNSVHIKIAGRGEAWRMGQSTNADSFYDAVEPPSQTIFLAR